MVQSKQYDYIYLKMRKTTLLILFILPLLCYSQTQWGWEIIDTTKIVCQYKEKKVH